MSIRAFINLVCSACLPARSCELGTDVLAEIHDFASTDTANLANSKSPPFCGLGRGVRASMLQV